MSNWSSTPTVLIITTGALCSPQPHAKNPQVANKHFAVEAALLPTACTKKNCTTRHQHRYSHSSNKHAKGLGKPASPHVVLHAVNVNVDRVLSDPFPCAPIGAALPEVVRGHDHGASIDMQRVTPVVALRLRHLNGSRACRNKARVVLNREQLPSINTNAS